MTARRRHVFFLSGFDPKGASYYHGLYVAQAALQGKITDTVYTVGPRVRLADGNTSWDVRSVAPDSTVTATVIEYARWDDIVRAHWPRTAAGVLRGALRVYRMVLGASPSLRKTWGASPRTLVSLAWPPLVWLVAVVACLLGSWLALRITGSWLAGVTAAAGILWFATQMERRLNTTWLLRIYQFALDWSEGRVALLSPRIEQFTQSVHLQLEDPDIDEVLLVGFSVGSLWTASITARLLQREAPMDKLSIMTLAQCIPLLGLMPNAHAFREDLAAIAKSPLLDWVDYSSPVDWGSFALADPLALCLGCVPQRAPRLASPRFHTLFPPGRYKLLRRDKRRMHLQYLMAGELASSYDYFALTAGRAWLDRNGP